MRGDKGSVAPRPGKSENGGPQLFDVLFRTSCELQCGRRGVSALLDGGFAELFPEFGTLLAHILRFGWYFRQVHFLVISSGLSRLGWSHPPGSNRRPADYETIRVKSLL